MAHAQPSLAIAPASAGGVPASRIVRVPLVRKGQGASPLFARAGFSAPRTASAGTFLTRAERQRLVGRIWISIVLSVWAILMIYAGRDGIKPQDPANAVPMPHMIRK